MYIIFMTPLERMGNKRQLCVKVKLFFLQGFGSAFFFADPDPGKNLHADPDPGGIRGRGLG